MWPSKKLVVLAVFSVAMVFGIIELKRLTEGSSGAWAREGMKVRIALMAGALISTFICFQIFLGRA
jgi:hypothetical protein